jgi:muramoyltetrapeptide carboxypeptidase
MQADGCIVFMEEVGEPAYRVDRCLMQLELAGALRGVRGFAFGRFTEIPEDGSEEEMLALLAAVAERHGVPAVANFPIGHIEHNWTLPVGVRALLDGDACTLELIEPATN